MIAVQELTEDPVRGVSVCEELGDLDRLREPNVAAAIWRRDLPGDLQKWLAELPVNRLPSARVLTKVSDVRQTIMAICNSVHMPYSINRRILINDAGALAEQFAKTMQADVVRIRFDVVNDDACRKFHTDAVTARLVCTYRGPGTQYGIASDGSEPQRVFSVPTGSPMALRGSLWSEAPKSGLVHRSPPIEGNGITRLVFVVDPVAEGSE